MDVSQVKGLADLKKCKAVHHPNPSRGVCVYCGYPILRSQTSIDNIDDKKLKAHYDCFIDSDDRYLGGGQNPGGSTDDLIPPPRS